VLFCLPPLLPGSVSALMLNDDNLLPARRRAQLIR
jgi:hypothetical protein